MPTADNANYVRVSAAALEVVRQAVEDQEIHTTAPVARALRELFDWREG